MNSRSSSSMSLFRLLSFSWLLLVIIKFPPCWSFDLLKSCSNRFTCGNVTGVQFPFWGDDRLEGCGYPHLYLHCDKNKPTIEIRGVKYNVLVLDQKNQTLQISRDDFSNGLCSPTYPNTTFDSQQFEYGPEFGEITFHYDCPPGLNGVLGFFPCPGGSTHKDGFIGNGPQTMGCNSSLKVGIGRNYFIDTEDWWKMEQALIKEGFKVKYKVNTWLCDGCTKSGGVCGYDWASKQPTCYCADGSSGQRLCPPSSSPKSQTKGTIRINNTIF
nr:LEAF RUST 10 DISEASE-RESISTANCE LOCUS RECEPTOR-LIKE PROTEIN KINASE-like 1.3 [Ziziphus jujuba var. spinosa]